MSMKEISPVSFGGEAERLGMVSMHSRCLPWLPDNTWSLQRWVQESKRKRANNHFSVSQKKPIYWNKWKKKSMLTLVLFPHRRTHHILLFLPAPVLVPVPSLSAFCPYLYCCFTERTMGAQESWFLREKQQPDTGKRCIEKKCLDVFCSKIFYGSNLLSCGAVVISVAVALEDNQFHPWPKGCCGLLYCTLLFKVYVCTGPSGGITGDCPCINHNHQWLISNVSVSPAQAVREKQQADVVVLLPAWLLTSGSSIPQKRGRGRVTFPFHLKYLRECTEWFWWSFATLL